MKQLIILFVVLFGSFLGIWTYKIYTPVNRPDEYAEGVDENAGDWWNSASVSVDDDWQLDPEIPLNYIPVPGEDELYMVIDNDGNITGYRRRTQQIDGSWLWEDVNPDIPENYEAVAGLADVYKVTNEDGTVQYFKYVRNDDDTFAFVEVDENGNPIDRDRDATVIDGKHVHISDNTYALLNDYGIVIGYDKRVDNGDGTYSWVSTDLPELADLSDLYAGSSLGSDLPTDDSAFDQSLDTSSYGTADAGSGDATYNYNITIEQPDDSVSYSDDYGSYSALDGSSLVDPYGGATVVNNGDGTHTEEETVVETKVVDGVTYTYETYVKKTYDAAGNLISTISDGPYETATQQNLTQETNPVQSISDKESTLSGEVARVTGSYTYDTSLESEVFTLLNSQRASNGIASLTRTDDADSIAQLRAADMAGYDTSDEDLPTYGTLGTMLADYSLTSPNACENLWKSIEHTADDIHTRLQAVDSSRDSRMSTDVTQYGIAIVEQNGYLYICEVFL